MQNEKNNFKTENVSVDVDYSINVIVDNNSRNNWQYWNKYIQDKNKNIWKATLNIATSDVGEKILYDISPIKIVERSVESDAVSTIGSIAQSSEDVNISDKNFSESEIKEDSSRLKNLSQKEFETIRDGFGKRLNEIADSITDTKIKNPLIARQSAMSQIVDAINTSRTKSGMLRALQQYNPKATEMTVQDIIDLVNDISNMPTEYFEAKPRRAVGLDEIRAILIPSNASEDLKTALSDYNTVEYEAENTEDRILKLNSLNDLKFSLAVDDKNYEKPITVEDVDILRSIGRKSINDFTSKDIQKSQK